MQPDTPAHPRPFLRRAYPRAVCIQSSVAYPLSVRRLRLAGSPLTPPGHRRARRLTAIPPDARQEPQTRLLLDGRPLGAEGAEGAEGADGRSRGAGAPAAEPLPRPVQRGGGRGGDACDTGAALHRGSAGGARLSDTQKLGFHDTYMYNHIHVHMTHT